MDRDAFKVILSELDFSKRIRIGISVPDRTQFYFGRLYEIQAEEPGLSTGPVIRVLVEGDIPQVMGWYLYKVVSIEQWLVD